METLATVFPWVVTCLVTLPLSLMWRSERLHDIVIRFILVVVTFAGALVCASQVLQ